MLNIRKSMFETNSSSSHSIIISKNTNNNTKDYFTHDWTNYPTLKLDEDDLSWGRSPFEFLNTFESKLCYLIPSIKFTEEKFNEIISIVNQILKENGINVEANIKLPEIEEYDWKKGEYTGKMITYSGDIDHQSMGLFNGFITKYKLTYKEFLENPNIQVIIDGDEYCYFYDMIDTGIIDKNKVEIYPNRDY